MPDLLMTVLFPTFAAVSPLTINLVALLAIGSLAYWLGWRLKVPSILLLLAAGLLLGPVLGMVHPDALLGEALFPLVAAAVGVILFEGGLTLRLRDLKESGGPIWRLVILGFAISWLLTTLLAVWLLEFRPMMAALFGALLSVTGPTVIGPMLRVIRLPARLKNIAKWEGILIDPIGVLAAVLVYEAFTHGGVAQTPGVFLTGVVTTLVVSGVLGGLAAGLLILAVRHRQVPEFLHNQVVLTLVLAIFFISDAVQEESGLVTVTLFGALLANQRIFRVEHIVHFKENLRTLFISGLFLLLAARVQPETIGLISWHSLLFVLGLLVLVRPLSVWLSTMGSGLARAERIMLCFLAPRGIIATALASVFALRLSADGAPEAETMLAVTLLVVIGTVTFYGLSAGFVARRLGLSNPSPQGLLIIGAHRWARTLASRLQEAGASVVLVDRNPFNITCAHEEGLKAYHGNVLSTEFLENIDLSDVGWAVCLTANNEVNQLAQNSLLEFMERTHVFRLSPEVTEDEAPPEMPLNPLFGRQAGYQWLSRQIQRGAIIESAALLAESRSSDIPQDYGETVLPLFSVNSSGGIHVFAERDRHGLSRGEHFIYLRSQPEDPTIAEAAEGEL